MAEVIKELANGNRLVILDPDRDYHDEVCELCGEKAVWHNWVEMTPYPSEAIVDCDLSHDAS